MNSRSPVTIGIGSDKTFMVQLFKDDAPLDLTSMTGISAAFPAPDGASIVETFAGGEITVVGAAGAGRIAIAVPGKDSLQMNPNPVPEQFQDLQIIVTDSGVAQVDALSIPSSVVAGHVYSVSIDGQLFAYDANTGDTDLVVFNALLALIAKAVQPFAVSAVVSGGVGTALLTLTSTIPALGFVDSPSSNISKALITPNGGTRAQFIIQQSLNIVPQPYPLV